MKENFLSNTFSKIKKGAVIGATTAMSLLPMENLYGQNKDQDILSKNQKELFLNQEKISATTCRFEDFNPKSDKKLVKIEDEDLVS